RQGRRGNRHPDLTGSGAAAPKDGAPRPVAGATAPGRRSGSACPNSPAPPLAANGSYAVTASGAGLTSAKFNLANTYNTVAAFDQSKTYKSGSIIAVRLKVTNSLRQSIGSPSLVVKAVSVIGPGGVLVSPCNSQPGNLFTFDSGTYQFNLKTTGYKKGTYTS